MTELCANHSCRPTSTVLLLSSCSFYGRVTECQRRKWVAVAWICWVWPHAVLVARQGFQHRVASGLGLVEIFKGRAGDPDRAAAFINRTPRRQITGASVKAWTCGALITDHERIAFASCAPYFHVLDGTVELQGHCQSVPLVERPA